MAITIGTIHSSKKGIPPEIKVSENREDKSYEIYWGKSDGKLCLNSYVTNTKSKGIKNVLLLSTVPPLLGLTKDDGKKKPAIYKLHDFTKGGTDVIDQRIHFYTSNSKSHKWTVNAFSYILDTARVNSQTVFSFNTNVDPRKQNSYSYAWELCVVHRWKGEGCVKLYCRALS